MRIFSSEKTPKEKLINLRSDFLVSIFIALCFFTTEILKIFSIPFLLLSFYCLIKYLKLRKEINLVK